MGWVRLDDQIADHPKLLKVGPAAAWLFVCSITYANRYLTDGFIPADQLPRLTGLRYFSLPARCLLAVGLWETVDGGWQIHDYLDYQPSRDTIKKRQNGARTRMARLRGQNVRANNEQTDGDVRTNKGRTKGDVRAKFGDPNPTQVLPSEVPVVMAEIPLSPEAREVVEAWRAAHGKRRPPKLNPALRTALEQAVQDLGVARLCEAAEWSARNEVPEFIKCVRAAYTQRQKEDEATERARPAARSGMARDSRNPRDYFAAAKR